MGTGSVRVQVVPTDDGRWEIHEPGAVRALATAKNQTQAIRRARAQLTRGGTLEIVDATGQITRTQQVPPRLPQPWWYTRSGLQRWVLPALFVVQMILGLVNYDNTRPIWWAYVFVGLGGIFLFVLGACSRHRDRRLARAEV